MENSIIPKLPNIKLDKTPPIASSRILSAKKYSENEKKSEIEQTIETMNLSLRRLTEEKLGQEALIAISRKFDLFQNELDSFTLLGQKLVSKVGSLDDPTITPEGFRELKSVVSAEITARQKHHSKYQNRLETLKSRIEEESFSLRKEMLHIQEVVGSRIQTIEIGSNHLLKKVDAEIGNLKDYVRENVVELREEFRNETKTQQKSEQIILNPDGSLSPIIKQKLLQLIQQQIQLEQLNTLNNSSSSSNSSASSGPTTEDFSYLESLLQSQTSQTKKLTTDYQEIKKKIDQLNHHFSSHVVNLTEQQQKIREINGSFLEFKDEIQHQIASTTTTATSSSSSSLSSPIPNINNNNQQQLQSILKKKFDQMFSTIQHVLEDLENSLLKKIQLQEETINQLSLSLTSYSSSSRRMEELENFVLLFSLSFVNNQHQKDQEQETIHIESVKNMILKATSSPLYSSSNSYSNSDSNSDSILFQKFIQMTSPSSISSPSSSSNLENDEINSNINNNQKEEEKEKEKEEKDEEYDAAAKMIQKNWKKKSNQMKQEKQQQNKQNQEENQKQQQQQEQQEQDKAASFIQRVWRFKRLIYLSKFGKHLASTMIQNQWRKMKAKEELLLRSEIRKKVIEDMYQDISKKGIEKKIMILSSSENLVQNWMKKSYEKISQQMIDDKRKKEKLDQEREEKLRKEKEESELKRKQQQLVEDEIQKKKLKNKKNKENQIETKKEQNSQQEQSSEVEKKKKNEKNPNLSLLSLEMDEILQSPISQQQQQQQQSKMKEEEEIEKEKEIFVEKEKERIVIEEERGKEEEEDEEKEEEEEEENESDGEDYSKNLELDLKKIHDLKKTRWDQASLRFKRHLMNYLIKCYQLPPSVAISSSTLSPRSSSSSSSSFSTASFSESNNMDPVILMENLLSRCFPSPIQRKKAFEILENNFVTFDILLDFYGRCILHQMEYSPREKMEEGESSLSSSLLLSSSPSPLESPRTAMSKFDFSLMSSSTSSTSDPISSSSTKGNNQEQEEFLSLMKSCGVTQVGIVNQIWMQFHQQFTRYLGIKTKSIK